MGKVFEKLINNRSRSFLNKYDTLIPFSTDSKRNHSRCYLRTNGNSGKLTVQIVENLKDNVGSEFTIIDFTKAYK